MSQICKILKNHYFRLLQVPILTFPNIFCPKWSFILLSFFSRNLFINLVALLLLTVALHGYHIYSYESQLSEWNSSTLGSFFSLIDSNKYFKILFAVLLILVQAYLINEIVIKHKLSRALSTLPAATFILYSCWVMEPVVFQPILIANLFCILSLWNLFKIYKKHLPVVYIFNSGLFITLAAIFYPAYLVYTIVLLFGLLSLRKLNLREIIQVISGVLVPYFLLAVYLFYTDQLADQVWSFVAKVKIAGLFDNLDFLALLKPIIVILMSLFLAIVHTGIKKKKKFDAIKKIELSYWMLLISVLSIFLMHPLSESHLLMLSIPISITMGMVLEHKSNRVIKEFLFIVALAGYGFFLLDIV